MTDTGRVARPQSEKDAESSVQAGDVVGQGRGAGCHGNSAWFAGKKRQPGEGVSDASESGEVAIRAGLSVGGHPKKDHAGVEFLHGLVPEVPLLEDTGTEVLHHDVDIGHQVANDLPPPGRIEINGDGTLVTAFTEPDQGVPAVGVGTEAPEVVPRTGALDLDHVGSEFPEQGGAEGTGNVGAEVENPNSF